MHLYLGIDFGTTGVRTSVINEKKEELINHSVSIESPTSKGPLVYQNPNLWWDALLKNFHYLKLKINLEDIKSLSIDGTSGTVLITNELGDPIVQTFTRN